MGGSGSKPTVAPKAPIFTPDYSGATFSAAELQRQLQSATAQASAAVQSATAQATAATQSKFAWVWPTIKWFFIPAVVILLVIVLYDSLAPDSWPNIFFDKAKSEVAAAQAQAQAQANSQSQTPSTVAAAPPPILKKLWSSITGGSSGDLAPSYHDATSSVTIKGSEAPLSSESEGGYGMQWWMFVKDWNYGYGKQKSVVKRPDTTNSSVLNPHISLHPTDNTLQISVSVFPATEGGSSKATPAPAGHSGSTDDVFICEVPNIPLQTWFSVSVTVFGRNLDVYIDGKLVKSCFLSGVPKPTVGDIQLTPEGGFSGRICNFYHYPRMLTPADADTFYSAGTSCRSKTESGISGKATGYSIKFGVYDSLGKEVQEYAF